MKTRSSSRAQHFADLSTRALIRVDKRRRIRGTSAWAPWASPRDETATGQCLTRTFSGADDGIRNPRPSPWQREETRPCGPSSPLMWTSVRPFVRLVRPVRPFRLPVYHRPRQRASTEVNLAQRVPKPPSSNRSAAGRGPCQTSQRLRWARSARSPTNESALDDGCHSTNERSSTRPRARARGGKLEGADRRLWAPLYGDHARSGVRRLSDMRRRSC